MSNAARVMTDTNDGPTVATAPTTHDPRIVVGSIVMHAKLGRGVVRHVDGYRITIKFDSIRRHKRVINAFLSFVAAPVASPADNPLPISNPTGKPVMPRAVSIPQATPFHVGAVVVHDRYGAGVVVESNAERSVVKFKGHKAEMGVDPAIRCLTVALRFITSV